MAVAPRFQDMPSVKAVENSWDFNGIHGDEPVFLVDKLDVTPAGWWLTYPSEK
jgi:hypothetical protein